MQNLEEAYKKSIQEETPDLWARIEEKLPEKKKKRKIVSITRYIGVAAAALFLCLLIPGMLRIAGGKKSADSSAEMAFDTATNFYSAGAAAQVTEGAESAEVGQATSQDAAPEEAETKDFCFMDGAVGNTENMELADEETMANGLAKVETLQESLTVQEIVQCDEYKVLVLSAADGNEWRAYASNDLDATLKTGETYDFTLQKQEGEDWEYVVVAAE